MNATQIVTLAEITFETVETVEALVTDISEEREASIISDLATWATIRDSHVKLRGGSKGVDFDNERKRDAIRARVRNILGLDPVPVEDIGSTSVRHAWAW